MSEIKITVKEYKHLLSIMFCAETSLESAVEDSTIDRLTGLIETFRSEHLTF